MFFTSLTPAIVTAAGGAGIRCVTAASPPALVLPRSHLSHAAPPGRNRAPGESAQPLSHRRRVCKGTRPPPVECPARSRAIVTWCRCSWARGPAGPAGSVSPRSYSWSSELRPSSGDGVPGGHPTGCAHSAWDGQWSSRGLRTSAWGPQLPPDPFARSSPDGAPSQGTAQVNLPGLPWVSGREHRHPPTSREVQAMGSCHGVQAVGFRPWDTGCVVLSWGTGCGVQAVGCRPWGIGHGVQAMGCCRGVQVMGCRPWSAGRRV